MMEGGEREDYAGVGGFSSEETGNVFFGGSEVISIEEASTVMGKWADLES
jgi:hypothetical protein